MTNRIQVCLLPDITKLFIFCFLVCLRFTVKVTITTSQIPNVESLFVFYQTMIICTKTTLYIIEKQDGF